MKPRVLPSALARLVTLSPLHDRDLVCRSVKDGSIDGRIRRGRLRRVVSVIIDKQRVVNAKREAAILLAGDNRTRIAGAAENTTLAPVDGVAVAQVVGGVVLY